MKITPTIAKRKLDSAISAISDISWLYSKDPESNFTRERKLPMNSVLRLLLKFRETLNNTSDFRTPVI